MSTVEDLLNPNPIPSDSYGSDQKKTQLQSDLDSNHLVVSDITTIPRKHNRVALQKNHYYHRVILINYQTFLIPQKKTIFKNKMVQSFLINQKLHQPRRLSGKLIKKII